MWFGSSGYLNYHHPQTGQKNAAAPFRESRTPLQTSGAIYALPNPLSARNRTNLPDVREWGIEEVTPYEKGKRAGTSSAMNPKNPYGKGTIEFQQWQYGFDEGCRIFCKRAAKAHGLG